jgi:hypothetical protein
MKSFSEMALSIQRFIDTTVTGCTIDTDVRCGDGELQIKYIFKSSEDKNDKNTDSSFK